MALYAKKLFDPDLNEDFADDFSLEALDDGNDLYVESEINHEERFKAASNEIKRKKRFTNEHEAEEFLRQYDDVVDQCIPKLGGNLLHSLIEVVRHTDDVEPEEVKLLVLRMVEGWPRLLKDVNRDGHNPVSAAIRHSQHKLVNYMLAACQDGSCLDSALSRKAHDGNTCLHIALKENLDLDTTRRLIERASDDALAVQNDLGKTPMHYALSFNKCRDARAELIAFFIDRDLKALQNLNSTWPQQTFLDLCATSGRSVYREHEHTRAQVVMWYQAYQERQRQDSTGDNKYSGTRDAQDADSPASIQSPGSEAVFSPSSDVVSEREKEQEPVTPKRKPRDGSNAGKAMTELLRNSDAILLTLKLHYMRTRSAERAISFLYGNNIDEVQIGFDYDQLPRQLLWNQFVKRFGADAKSGLRFDRVLQYVTFPPVEVIRKGRRADAEREAELQSGVRQVGPLGRKDMQYFFDWLWAKGVRHIIRLTVEDSGDSGEKVHSDQAIQASLERFVVEHLDWKKTDLDPETILRVSSKAETETGVGPDRQLRQLYLRWSGSNAVLRGWSEPEGLAMLPHLSRIVLFAPPASKTYDNGPWVLAKVDEFRERLNANRRTARSGAQQQLKLEVTTPEILDVGDISGAFNPVEVILVDADADDERRVALGDASYFNSSDSVKGINSHRWLDSTARFAGEMIPFWKTTVDNFLESRQNQPTPEGLESDVVVALIDDGVDMFDTPLADQILEGKSFDFHDGRVRPPFASAKGHGTVMANMILRVCPMAKIYPIRLKTYPAREGKSMKIDAGYAAQAIQAALDKKAAIISMSWTIPMTKGDGDAKRRLHNVLATAVNNRVLMFCSAPDGGKFTELDYPSGPWRDRFFRIGAAAADGTVFQWTPEDGITYVLPGVDVVREQAASTLFGAPSMQKLTMPNRMAVFHETGSSVATALAAGLAAMIIYCVKASILAVKTVNHGSGPLLGLPPDDAAELIAHPDEMRRAFASLGRVTPNKFVQVWDGLDRASEQLEALRAPMSTPEMKLNCVKAFVDFGLKLWNAAMKEY